MADTSGTTRHALVQEATGSHENEPPRVWRFVVPYDCQRTSQNQRFNWRDRNEAERAAAEIGRATWMAAGMPRAAGPVRVSVLVRREKALDLWNIPGCLKGLIDGMFRRAVTEDDGPKHIVEIGSIRQETGREWRDRPSVIVTVEELT